MSCRPATCWYVTGSRSRRESLRTRPNRVSRCAKIAAHPEDQGRRCSPGRPEWPSSSIPPRSALIGTTMFPGMARERRTGRARDPAAWQRPRNCAPPRSAEGDTVLVHGRWSAIESLAGDRDRVGRRFARHGASANGSARSTRPAGDRGAARRWWPCWPPARYRRRVAGLIAATAMVALRVVGVRGSLPGDLVADGGVDRRADPAVHRDPDQRGSRSDRGMDRRPSSVNEGRTR